jgi:ADP-ribosylglycohydrolase
MEPNTRILDRLVAQGAIRCAIPKNASALAPELDNAPARDRIEGMLLGVAIGDSLGNTSEGMLPASRRSRYGEIRDYQRNRRADTAPYSFPSDDTQMTFWALESILAEGGVAPDSIARAFSSNRIYGIGSAVREFLVAYRAGRPWYEAGPEKAGNGALMRVSPLIFPSLINGGDALLADVALGSMLTHNDSASISASESCLGNCW